jgi:mRNA interferase MazF
MHRGEIYWAELPEPWGHRPALIVSREHAVQVRESVCIAQITSRIRGLKTETILTKEDGLPKTCVVNCDNLATVGKEILRKRIARLSSEKMRHVNQCLRVALGLDHEQ